MKRRSQFAVLLMPWAGLAVGILAAGAVHQFGSQGVFDHCRPMSPIPLLVACVLGIAVTVIAALASGRVLRDQAETQARKVVAVVSVGMAALFILSMILPMFAALILPACFQ